MTSLPRPRLLAAVLLCLALGACGHDDPPAPDLQSSTFPVEVAPAQAQAYTSTITAPGALEPFESQMISARVSGVVERIAVSEGDAVKVGQVLATIEPERFRLALALAQAAEQRAEATESDAQAAYGRRERLNETATALVNAEELAQYKAREAQASADLASAHASLARAQLDLEQASITAPVDGVIQARLIQTGQYAVPGTAIASVVQRDPMRLRFAVPVPVASRFKGMTVHFTTPGSTLDYRATVSFVAAQADAATRLVTVLALVDGSAPELVPGAFAEVTAVVGSTEQVVVIPETAVRPSERGFLVYVVTPGKDPATGTAVERTVEVLSHTSSGDIALHAGVVVGEQIVTRGVQALHDGAAVRIVHEAPVAAAAGQQ